MDLIILDEHACGDLVTASIILLRDRGSRAANAEALLALLELPKPDSDDPPDKAE